MPLGIELSAAWVGLLSIAEIAREIEQNLDFLSVSMRDLPERHRSMRATLDHSWKLLNPEEKLILSRLSVFHGTFSRKAAQAICGASLAVLSSLKNKSLLQRTDQDDYGLHEIIRQYAGLKLAELPDENARIKDQHALYFVQYLSDGEAALQSSQQVETFDDMAKVIDDLSRGWQHMVTHCLPSSEKSKPFPAHLIHSALFSISLFYEQRCRNLEALTLFSESVEFLKTVQAIFEDTEDRFYFYSILGHITAYLGLHLFYVQNEMAIEYLNEALILLEKGQSWVERAQAQVMLAGARYSNGQLKDSADLLNQSREFLRKEGVHWWYALSTIHLASTYLSLGKLVESVELFREGLQLVEPGDIRIQLNLRDGLAIAHYLQNDFAKAEQLLQSNLQLSYRLGNDRETAYTFFNLSRVALAENRVEQAEEYVQKSISILQRFGESRELAMTHIILGDVFAARSDRNAARDQFRQAIRIGQVVNKFHLVCYGLVSIAGTYMVDGQTQQALEIYLHLRCCPIEIITIQNRLDRLHADLRAALPEGQMEGALMQVEDRISPDQARADVLLYVKEHETGS